MKWKKKKTKKKLIKNEIVVDFAVYSLYNVLMSNVETEYNGNAIVETLRDEPRSDLCF